MFDFLAGLNKDLDEVLGRVLEKEPVTSLDEVFAQVKREENRRKVMLGEEKDSINTLMEGSALASKGGDNGYHGEQRTRRRMCYDHCNRLGHTKDKCWPLHGKPTNWRPR